MKVNVDLKVILVYKVLFCLYIDLLVGRGSFIDFERNLINSCLNVKLCSYRDKIWEVGFKYKNKNK